jgi:hypothetical protein
LEKLFAIHFFRTSVAQPERAQSEVFIIKPNRRIPMKKGMLAFLVLVLVPTFTIAEIDTFQEFSGWLRDGYLHHTGRIPSYDGELFSNPCPTCGNFESNVQTFCVNRPQWDFDGDNNMDCDLVVEVKNTSTGNWDTVGVSASWTNEESVNCGQACEDKYVRIDVYDYQRVNSGVVGARFGKGHD